MSEDDPVSIELTTKKLEQLVKQLEGEELSLEQSMSAFAEGVSLCKEANKYLEEATQRVARLETASESTEANPDSA